jgi:phage tail sheath gpL-like
MIPFNRVPSNIRVPFFWAEINSGGSPYEGFPRPLLIGQKLSGGVAAANVLYGPISSAADADAQFGVGSMLAAMYRIAALNAPFQPIYALPLADPSGAAAAGTVSVNGGTSLGKTGVGTLYVLGRRVDVQVNAADAAATTAAAIAAAINALNVPVSAAVDGTNTYQVNVTARHVGALGNGQEVIVAADTPNVFTGSNITITALSGGSGTPALDTALANLGDEEFDWLAMPYADTTSLNSIRAFLSDNSGRWSPQKQLYGHCVAVNFGTLSTQTTLGAGRNDQHATILGSQASPTPQWEWAAALAGVVVQHLANPPELSRPLQTLILDGVLPPRSKLNWWTTSDRQALYTDGIAGYKVDVEGNVRLDRVITTYQQTAAGVPDATFLDIETMAQLMYATRYFKTAVSNKHARQALADDNPFANPAITTPRDIKNTLIHAYNDLVALGVLENGDIFAANVNVERDALDANRVNASLPLDTVNQLRVIAVNETAFLQARTASGALALQ